MTDLERLFRRLVHVLSAADPARLRAPIAIGELRGTLLPYRANRRAVQIESSEDYELALLRLCAGEAGFAETSPLEARQQIQREVASPNPDLDLLRRVADATLSLSPTWVTQVQTEASAVIVPAAEVVSPPLAPAPAPPTPAPTAAPVIVEEPTSPPPPPPPSLPAMTNIGVVGCGLMGSGIAQAAATAGFLTTVRDLDDAMLERGRATIRRSLDKLVDKGKLDASVRDAAWGRLSFVTDLTALRGSDLIVEAVTEEPAIKAELWQALDRLCPPATIFASNTSSLPITDMAAATSRPDRWVGLHFFNPVPLMPLVEVVRAVTTSPATWERAFEFVRALGKEPVAAKDNSGFIVNLLLVPYLLDAARAVERGVASVTDIDTAMRLGCGHPMGPLTLLDFVGLDTTVRIAEIMFDEYRETRYAAPPLLRRMVAAGYYGRKNGRGFYDYATDPPTPTDLGL